MWVEHRERTKVKIARAARVGVDYAGDWAHKRWRFFDSNSAYVSTLTTGQRRRLRLVRAD
jgi:3-methyladenine DNA glycosylase Mpg